MKPTPKQKEILNKLHKLKKKYWKKHMDSAKKVKSSAGAGYSIGYKSALIDVEKLFLKAMQESAREERELKVSDMGFYDLVDMVEIMLEMRYPEDVFNGSSGDSGAVFTFELRKIINSLKQS